MKPEYINILIGFGILMATYLICLIIDKYLTTKLERLKKELKVLEAEERGQGNA